MPSRECKTGKKRTKETTWTVNEAAYASLSLSLRDMTLPQFSFFPDMILLMQIAHATLNISKGCPKTLSSCPSKLLESVTLIQAVL